MTSSTSNISTKGPYAEWTNDSQPVSTALTECLGATGTSKALVVPDLVKIIVDFLQVVNCELFGEEEWETLFGRVSPAPALRC